jgi:hypothetical protein
VRLRGSFFYIFYSEYFFQLPKQKVRYAGEDCICELKEGAQIRVCKVLSRGAQADFRGATRYLIVVALRVTLPLCRRSW